MVWLCYSFYCKTSFKVVNGIGNWTILYSSFGEQANILSDILNSTKLMVSGIFHWTNRVGLKYAFPTRGVFSYEHLIRLSFSAISNFSYRALGQWCTVLRDRATKNFICLNAAVHRLWSLSKFSPEKFPHEISNYNPVCLSSSVRKHRPTGSPDSTAVWFESDCMFYLIYNEFLNNSYSGLFFTDRPAVVGRYPKICIPGSITSQ